MTYYFQWLAAVTAMLVVAVCIAIVAVRVQKLNPVRDRFDWFSFLTNEWKSLEEIEDEVKGFWQANEKMLARLRYDLARLANEGLVEHEYREHYCSFDSGTRVLIRYYRLSTWGSNEKRARAEANAISPEELAPT